MNVKLIVFSAVAMLLLAGNAFAQSEYGHGNGALQVFDSEGQANSPRWVMIWVMLMGASFAAGLFFIKNHPIARWVVGGFVAGIACMLLLGKLFGLPPVSGYIATVHILFWSPALYQLLTKRPFLDQRSAFSIWSGVITFVILFSFVFDIRDAFIYLRHLV